MHKQSAIYSSDGSKEHHIFSYFIRSKIISSDGLPPEGDGKSMVQNQFPIYRVNFHYGELEKKY